MSIKSMTGDPDLAMVYVAAFSDSGREKLVEFVDASDPESTKEKKWVIIISTQFGCPVACPICDAGASFEGNLSSEQMFAQIDHVVALHPRSRLLNVEKFKVQFARMGEPSLNPFVLDVLSKLPQRYEAKGLIPCIATIAPASARDWFAQLLDIRKEFYSGREFQLQLSINSTCDATRDRLMPVPKMSFKELAEVSERFYDSGTRKVALNFAVADGIEVDSAKIKNVFDPKHCCIKITPLNPTINSAQNGFMTAVLPDVPETARAICEDFASKGFDVILSIGDTRENEIGSNCGMAVRKFRSAS